MDKEERKARWDWLPAAMPGLAALMAEKRKTMGAAHVAECWKRGVINREPGWLFAREAALSVGTPPAGDAQLIALAFSDQFATQAFLYIREPEVQHGQA